MVPKYVYNLYYCHQTSFYYIGFLHSASASGVKLPAQLEIIVVRIDADSCLLRHGDSPYVPVFE